MSQPSTDRIAKVHADVWFATKVGTMLTIASALVAASIFIWSIKTNAEQSVSEIKNLREEMTPALRKIDRLWWEYEMRTTGAPRPSSASAP